MRLTLLGSFMAALILAGCGTSSDTAINTFSIAAPAMAITSPTQGTAATTASLSPSSWIKTASLALPGFAKIAALFTKSARAAEETDKPTELKPIGEMNTDAKNDFLLPPADVIAKFGGFDAIKEYRAPCFGPSWTDGANGSSTYRYTGDLGIVYATRDNVSAEACAAAQMNALIAGKPHLFNKVRLLVTAMLAKANADGKALPAIGAFLDVTMPAATGFAFTKAKLSRLDNDADGNTVYKTEIEGTIGPKDFKIVLHHTPTNADNTEFKGLFQAIMPNPAIGLRGLSVIYNKTGTTMTLLLDSAANIGAAGPDFFDTTTGRVLFTKAAAGQDLNRMIATFDTATGASTVHYAWQAGAIDVASRDFAVTTTGVAEGSTGIAYYGFGNPLKGGTPLTDSTTTIWPTKMICDWVTPPKTPQPFIEKQTMTYTSGQFTPDVSKINFAPVDTCNNASWTVTGGPPFLNRTNTTPAHDLVAYSSDIPAVTAPTYTLP